MTATPNPFTRTARRVGATLALSALLPLPLMAAPSAAAAEPVADAPTVLASDQNGRTPALPRPTGREAVGLDTRHLVDHSRADPWAPHRPRELMVSLYYPAKVTTGQRVDYLSRAEAGALLRGLGRDKQIRPATFAATRTNAYRGAPPAEGRRPLVLLSPGAGVHRAALSGLAEELASRGSVVALLDHAYESFGTEFPGGRMLDCRACEAVDEDHEYSTMANNRALDVSFVLDRLTGVRPGWRHAGMIDRERIGMAGHSLGGNTTARAMAADPRIRAGANLDGTFFAPVPPAGLNGRPFLLLGAEPMHRPGGSDRSWPRDWNRLDGWKRWLTVSGSGHYTFTDLPVLAGQVGIAPDPGFPLSGSRSGEITNDYTAAFFDQHLRGIRAPLLAGPSAADPEVTFHRPRAGHTAPTMPTGGAHA